MSLNFGVLVWRLGDGGTVSQRLDEEVDGRFDLGLGFGRVLL
jgi:hypothetical protein